eukprot:1150310-Pelagomonas_calceolata.AAC.4
MTECEWLHFRACHMKSDSIFLLQLQLSCPCRQFGRAQSFSALEPEVCGNFWHASKLYCVFKYVGYANGFEKLVPGVMQCKSSAEIGLQKWQ